jgi:Gpi18-like mannosyltransferase
VGEKEKMTRKQIIILVLTLLLALALRVYFIPAPGYERDIQLFKIWSQTAVEYGVHNVYDKTWCDYPPAYLYVLKVTGYIYRLFYPDFKEHTYLFNFLIKFPGILADLLISLIIFLFLKRSFSFRIGLLAMVAYAFNPAVFFNSAWWGQVDSVSILMVLLAVLALVKERDSWAWGLLTIGILIKTQMVILLPIFILITWRRNGFRSFMKGVTASWLTFVVVLAPFFYFHKVDRIINVVLNAVGEYPYLSMNAYNLWWLFSWGQGRWMPDTNLFLNFVSFRALGSILLGIFYVLLLRYLFVREKDEQALFLSCALAFFAFFMLPTEMHERYLLPVLPFLLLSSIGKGRLKISYGVLSFTAFFNLLMVLAKAYPKNFPLTAAFWQIPPFTIMISVINAAILLLFLFMLLRDVKVKYLVPYSAVILVLFAGFYFSRPPLPVFLSDLEPISVSQQWGKLKTDRSVDGKPLTVNGYKFAKGLGTHASSTIIYNLGSRYRFLEGWVGLDDEQSRGNKIEFFIYGDAKLVYKSGLIKGRQDPRYFHLPIKGIKELKLMVSDGGDGINNDHADWLGIKLLP